jgi:heterodisulfide reductase subunit B
LNHKYAYYPGCSLRGSAREYDRSARAVCGQLGIELLEILEWICCGSHPARIFNETLAVALPMKSLLKVERGDEVLTLCPSCFKSLKGASLKMGQDLKLRERVNLILRSDYQSGLRVRHLLEVLGNDHNDKLKSQIKKPLKGLKVTSYYGCLLARPKEIIDFDDPEDPMMMDRLLGLVGAEPIDWPYKTECCGMSFALSKPKIAIRLSGEVLQMAKESGAECIAVGCPLCQANLDLRQREIERERGIELGLPVLYFTQLLGLSIGVPHKELDLRRHMVNPYPLLRWKGIV